MKFFSTLFIAAFFLLNNQTSAIKRQDTDLVRVVVVSRHGPKAPNSGYPNYKYNNYWYKYQGFGLETPNGIKEQYEFGEYLRDFYNDVLKFNATKSLAVTLTIEYMQSASAFMGGILKPSNNLVWNEKLLWFPVPIEVLKTSLPELLESDECPKYEKLIENMHSSAEFVKLQDSFSDVMELIQDNTGIDNLGPQALTLVGQTLESNSAEELKQEEWARKNLKRIKSALETQTEFETSADLNLTKLNAGYLLNIVKNALGADDINYELVSYTVDKLEIASLYALLKNLNKPIPYPYFTSSLIFELRKDKKKHFYVNMGFKNNKPNHPIEIVPFAINGCDQLCPLDKFLLLIKDKVVTDLIVDCQEN